jgi:hypothetical protein
MSSHTSVIKYIHIKDEIPKEALHNLQDYEFAKAETSHSTFQELVNEVHRKCPAGYECIDPVALHHEVVWESSLRLHASGSHYVIEHDQLRHAIDEAEYALLKWTDKSLKPVSLCVHIDSK